MLDTIRRILLEAFPDAQAIYHFGSTARGEAAPGSDIDLALLLPHGTAKQTDSLALLDVSVRLTRALGRDVDLINAREVSTVFQMQILRTGQVIDCADDRARLEFEMRTLSSYFKLNEERGDILRQFQETHRAYAV
jgi:predicted nucleotidyltransferase